MVGRLLVDLCQDTVVSLACALKKGEMGGFFLATYSWSLKRWYSSSPTLTGDPPYCAYISQMFSWMESKLQIAASIHILTLHTTIRIKEQKRPQLTCGIKTLSPGATLHETLLPSLSNPPGPTAKTLASFNSLTLDSGRKMPPAVLASILTRWTRTRSSSGARDLIDLSAVDYSF